MDKKGFASFGTIVAIFGSILIALGFAWLIAQNWHQIPSPLKILILVLATASAYTGGVIFRLREYAGISKALIILGALLYTLSIFLVAQIFSTESTAQGIAWLLFLAIAGIILTSYLFESSLTLIIVVIEFFFWVGFQSSAFFSARMSSLFSGENASGYFVLSFLFLFSGYFLAIVSSFALFLYFKRSDNLKKTLNFGAVILSANAILFFILLIVKPLKLQISVYAVLAVFLAAIFLSYLLKSKSGLYLGFLELTILIIMQYFAFETAKSHFIKPGILALYLLLIGVVFYGLSLIHRAKEHEFGKAYQWWTVFYILLFAYFLSFQVILPVFWTKAAEATLSSILFMIFLGILGAASLITGVLLSLKNRSIQTIEVGIAVLIFALLALMISSTILASDKTGNCFVQSCYDLKSKNACNDAAANLNCAWNEKFSGNQNCQEKNCFMFNDKNSCEIQKTLSCQWNNEQCENKQCYSFSTEESCKSERCQWVNNNYCTEKNCNTFQNELLCSSSPQEMNCEWYQNNWGGQCQLKRPYCEQFNNQADSCITQKYCTWNPSSEYSFTGHGKTPPIVMLTLWIMMNILFIMIILAVIGYGTWQKIPKIINLGIIFFSLDIISRYIGFVMDFWGYTALSIIFISGGILLLVCGWGIEKWRRILIQKANK